ncbi:MAG: hypothetical protein HZA52_20495 [Planctomycetes bacterium]|nr:hypothetical protein [Planctomycetota bacterium]
MAIAPVGGASAQSSYRFPLPATPDRGTDLSAGHLDLDAFADLAAAHPTNDVVKIARGSGDGRFVDVGGLAVSVCVPSRSSLRRAKRVRGTVPEHASPFGRRARVAVAAVLLGISSFAAAQFESGAQAELPMIRGRVIRDDDGSNVVNALVEAYPAFQVQAETRTDDRGSFARIGKPQDTPTNRTNEEPYDLVEYMTVSSPGVARTFVDPCADAPWSAPIRVRATATLRGRVLGEPAKRGLRVVVTADWKDLCWPPNTGLTRFGHEWIAALDPDGGFELHQLPAEVPLQVAWSAGGTDANPSTTLLALAPGESHFLALGSNAGAGADTARTSDPAGPWILVDPFADTERGATPYLPAFEIVEGGRFRQHQNGGGRWHIHDSRACDHLEALAGVHTLVARDASGRFGITTFTVRVDDARLKPSVPLSPGALLRIDFDGPEERARVALVANGIVYAARDLPRGAVWYELAPAGAVELRVTGSSAAPRTVEVEARAGELQRVDV